MFSVFFFFSSRRRHTRSYGDWSSDVCSSDLDRCTKIGHCVEVIHRYSEEALDLWCVQIECHNAICPSCLDRVGADSRADRDSRLVLLVALGITEVRNDHRDRVSARTRKRVDPEEQLHEVRIGWKNGRLHEVNAPAANVLEHAHEQGSLREADNLACAYLDS